MDSFRPLIFIGSVFWEFNKEWRLRTLLAEKLRNEFSCKTWLWEENADEQQEKSNDWKKIVSKAIKQSDLVITFYKTRSGTSNDWWSYEIPFYPTDFEIAESVKFGIPLKLYFIKGTSLDDNLKGIKRLFNNDIILDNRPKYCLSETDFILKVMQDVEQFMQYQYFNLKMPILITPIAQNHLEQLEFFYTMLSSQIKSGDYNSAFSLVNLVPDIEQISPISKEEKVLLARCFALLANIYANRTLYRKAVRLVKMSIKLFMELGEWNEMFGQVQALSGIQNMIGLKSARYINEYGFKTTILYRNLTIDFNDSKASILRDMGHYNEALKLIEPDWDITPYSAAKYTYLLARSTRPKGINDAMKLMEDQILPRARTENKNLSYVLNIASELSILDNDYNSAVKFLNESEKICYDLGTLHTKRRILQIHERIPIIY